ncbi:RrF2 family transcriptional regulator [Calditerrivibrio nitroreducens]|uniref:Transcriptional regulator, BadM/Rrf2 family n=1 Tax=Calditerrivibrio nitroreducens (strain DSM 19672 / NBRC 101217 / Yu37-1) TaxID=768670 RepID=E4TEU5_CALNY|nr:Rrf2 family transcriptional regulator [Calditerrivibrio nitroreducens]ADR18351.1 transcriptional regulator, BadM/Rrf2 family [Calditerrivibrio nitroreducens DSM 19672]
MQTTAQSIYAIYALVYISYRNKPVNPSEISNSSSIPKRFLEITLNKLKHHGILKSKKGPNGGFILSKPPEKISLYDILSATESNLSLFDCEKHLPTGCHFKQFLESINCQHLNLLKSITLEDIRKQESQYFLDFII